MGLISSIRRKKIPGHKETASKELIHLSNEASALLYIPLLGNDGKAYQAKKEVGDSVKKGTLIATKIINEQNKFAVPVYAPASGKIKAIEDLFLPAAGRKVKHIVIANDFKYEEELLPKLINEKSSKEEIVDLIKEAGIIGLGGAGFPTYVKYSSTAKTILINGVECEPYLTSDNYAMKHDVEALLEGTMILIRAAAAENAIIAVKKNKPELIAKIREKVNSYPKIALVLVPDVYPMGWERTLVKQVFKKDYIRYPLELGVIVNNAQTAIAVYKALVDGKVISERIVTVSGAVKTCANVLVPIGTLAKNIIEELGGYCGVNLYLLPGGPMMAKAVSSDEFAIGIASNALTILPAEKIASEPCLRCGECIKHCPAGLMPVSIMEAVSAKDVERLIKLCTNDCVECGLCSYVCPSAIEVTEQIKKGKTQIRIHEAKKQMSKGGVK